MSLKSNPAFTLACGCIDHNGTTVIYCQEHKPKPPKQKVEKMGASDG